VSTLNANRKKRLLANLDKALARQGVKPPRRRAVAARVTEEARLVARSRSDSAKRSYGQLRAAILSSGGLRANQDYKRSEIPRDLYSPKGLAPDEMAAVLGVYGYHFDGDVDLFAEIGQRREETRMAREGSRKRKNPSLVCADNCRDDHGRFQVCPHGS
jgi:hypothetical protein